MITDDEHAAHMETIKNIAGILVRQAEVVGVVLTIEQVNKQPPVMGNYETVVSVRSMRRS